MLSRIKAVLLQDMLISFRSLEVVMDLPFFSIMTVASFGYITKFLSDNTNSFFPKYLLLGILLWEIMRVSQYSLTVGSYWNIWSRNLTNIFIAPISVTEYMLSHMISALFKSILVFALVAFLTKFIFGMNILDIGFANLLVYFLILVIFAWAMGIFILGFVFRFGSRYAALGWGLIFLFQPLMGTFFPIKILPWFLQLISLILPPTYIFEAARANLINQAMNFTLVAQAGVLDLLYLILSVASFHLMFLKSKDSGQFARNEG